MLVHSLRRRTNIKTTLVYKLSCACWDLPTFSYWPIATEVEPTLRTRKRRTTINSEEPEKSYTSGPKLATLAHHWHSVGTWWERSRVSRWASWISRLSMVWSRLIAAGSRTGGQTHPWLHQVSGACFHTLSPAGSPPFKRKSDTR